MSFASQSLLVFSALSGHLTGWYMYVWHIGTGNYALFNNVFIFLYGTLEYFDALGHFSPVHCRVCYYSGMYKCFTDVCCTHVYFASYSIKAVVINFILTCVNNILAACDFVFVLKVIC